MLANRIVFLSLSLYFFLAGSIQASTINVSKTLLDTFRGQCPNIVTRHVQGSLENVQGLMNVVEQLKEDSQCFGASNLVDVLNRYGRIYDEYEVYQNTKDGRKIAEEKIAYYTSLLSDPSLSETDRTLIRSDIYLAQSDLIGINTRISRFDNFSNRSALGASQVLTSVEGLLSTISSRKGCYENKSSLVGGLLSNSLLATAAFTNPVTALGVAASSVVTGTLSVFLNNFRYNKSLDYLDEIALPTAMRCVSQALSDQYCNSLEAKKLIHTHKDDEFRSLNNFSGIRLLSKDMVQLDHWLKEVFAGSAITSEGDLVNREIPSQQSYLLNTILRYIQTYGTLRRDAFAGIFEANKKSEAIALAISNLVIVMERPTLRPRPSFGFNSGGGNQTENPIFLSFDKQVLPYTLYDGNLTDIPSCPTTPDQDAPPRCQNFSDFIRNRGIILTESNWLKAIDAALKIVEEALELVNIARAKTTSLDPVGVMVRANADHRGEVNALQGLARIHEMSEHIAIYLRDLVCNEKPDQCESNKNTLRPKLTHRYYPQYINALSIGSLALSITQLVQEAYMPRSFPDQGDLAKLCGSDQDSLYSNPESDIMVRKNFKISRCITKLLKLAERGNDFFFQKVRDMVSYEIEARFLHNELEDEISDVVYATRDDLVETLKASFNQGDSLLSLSDISDGFETSMKISKDSFLEFYRFFDEGVETVFKRKLTSSELKDMCFKVLPALHQDIPGAGEDEDDLRKIDQKLFKLVYDKCKDVTLNFYKEGPTLVWHDYVEAVGKDSNRKKKKARYRVKKTKEELFCLLRGYHRKNLLLEERRRRLRRN